MVRPLVTCRTGRRSRSRPSWAYEAARDEPHPHIGKNLRFLRTDPDAWVLEQPRAVRDGQREDLPLLRQRAPALHERGVARVVDDMTQSDAIAEREATKVPAIHPNEGAAVPPEFAHLPEHR